MTRKSFEIIFFKFGEPIYHGKWMIPNDFEVSWSKIKIKLTLKNVLVSGSFCFNRHLVDYCFIQFYFQIIKCLSVKYMYYLLFPDNLAELLEVGSDQMKDNMKESFDEVYLSEMKQLQFGKLIS